MSASSRPTGGARLGQRDRQVDADRALAHAALAGGDGDDVLDARRGAAGPADGAARRTIAPQVISTSAAPIPARAARALRSISSLSGQAGVVSSIVKATFGPSIDDLLDHVEGHDVAAQLGLLDGAQGVEDGALGERAHLAVGSFRCGTRASRASRPGRDRSADRGAAAPAARPRGSRRRRSRDCGFARRSACATKPARQFRLTRVSARPYDPAATAAR